MLIRYLHAAWAGMKCCDQISSGLHYVEGNPEMEGG